MCTRVRKGTFEYAEPGETTDKKTGNEECQSEDCRPSGAWRRGTGRAATGRAAPPPNPPVPQTPRVIFSIPLPYPSSLLFLFSLLRPPKVFRVIGRIVSDLSFPPISPHRISLDSAFTSKPSPSRFLSCLSHLSSLRSSLISSPVIPSRFPRICLF